MPRCLFVNPPLVLDEDFIDYPYFANHGLLSCAGLAARAGAHVDVYDAFALAESGRHRRAQGGFVLGVEHDAFIADLPDGPYDVVVLGASVFVRIEAAHPETQELIAALRDQYPSAVLLLSDGYIGGQHYMDYDADRVLARYPELDAILKYPGERIFGDPEHLTTLKNARTIVRDAGARGADPLGPFYLLDGIDVRNFDGFLHRCFGDGAWQNTFGIDSGARSFLTSLHQQPWLATHGAQALPAHPAHALEALGVPAAQRVRCPQAGGARRDGERAHRLRGHAARVQRARSAVRISQRHARRSSQP
jgi:hypothetical protein